MSNSKFSQWLDRHNQFRFVLVLALAPFAIVGSVLYGIAELFMYAGSGLYHGAAEGYDRAVDTIASTFYYWTVGIRIAFDKVDRDDQM